MAEVETKSEKKDEKKEKITGSPDDNLKIPTRERARARAMALATVNGSTVNAAAGKLAAAATYGQAHHVPAEETRTIIEQEPDAPKIERLAATGTVRAAERSHRYQTVLVRRRSVDSHGNHR